MEDTEEFRKLHGSVGKLDEESAENTRRLYETIEGALDEYQKEATGHGNFERYVKFRSIVIEVQEGAKELDVHLEEDFEKATDRLDRQTLQQKHFTRARNDLEDVRSFIEDYKRYRRLEESLRNELHTLEREVEGLEEEIRSLEQGIQRARDAEGVDVSQLRDAVETYNQRVREDFDDFLREASAVEVTRIGEDISGSSLLEDVPIEKEASQRLPEYVDNETADRVLELADSSDGKLSHYFDDVDGFRSAVPRLWLESADAEPFVLSYEPEGIIKYKIRELMPVVSSFADERTVELLRSLKRLAETGEYSRMRSALVDRQEAGDDAESLEEQLSEKQDEKESAEERIEEIREVLPGESTEDR